MIASLPMYLTPENRLAHDAFWSLVRDALRDAGIAAPDHLSHDVTPASAWADETLVLSHICNLPYRLHFRSRLTRIAGSDYALEDCDPGFYRARFVVHNDHPAQTPEDLIGCQMAYNDGESHSGWGAAAIWARGLGATLRPTLRTGSHEASLFAVVAGKAEYATIDARTLELLKERHPEAQKIRVVGSTTQSPGMTFVTGGERDPEPFRRALRDALSHLPDEHRAPLGLRGFPVIPDDAYNIALPPLVRNAP
jgi:ABC-type phosphate/phosphonate transport system substrate-binding protein